MVNTPRILLSADALKVSKPGFDVLTSTDPKELSFDSSKKGLGVAATGTMTVDNSSRFWDITIPDLGYIPVVLFQYENPFAGPENQWSGYWADSWYFNLVHELLGTIITGIYAEVISNTQLRVIKDISGTFLIRWAVFYNAAV